MDTYKKIGVNEISYKQMKRNENNCTPPSSCPLLAILFRLFRTFNLFSLAASNLTQ